MTSSNDLTCEFTGRVLAKTYSTQPLAIHMISACDRSGRKNEMGASTRPINFSRVASPQVGMGSMLVYMPMGSSISAKPSSSMALGARSTTMRSNTTRHIFWVPWGAAM